MDTPTHDPGQLKLCPFCGGEAYFGSCNGWFVQCGNPLCQASSAQIFPQKVDPKPLLVERWNRRIDEQRLVSVERAARSLETWLSQNAGTTADWPVDLVARDVDAAETLTSLLNQLKRALDGNAAS